MKICNKCGVEKNETSFYWAIRDVRRKTICVSCVNSKKKIRGSREYYRHKFENKRKQSQNRGVNFNLSFDVFMAAREKNNCGYCGEIITGKKTIDRIDPGIGYTDSNIITSCFRCNRMKTTFSKGDIPYLEKLIQVLKNST